LDHINKAVKGFAPQPIHRADKYIVMEYIDMTSRGMHNQDTQRELGHRLGNMHKATSERFGFEVTSFCGTTELDNTWSTSWSHFWTKQRMEPLFDSVRGQNPDLDSMGQQLCARMDHWLGPDALPNITPALLHGDLWSGNWSIRQSDGMPIIYDPACYFGHSEAELGIMRMFGGFSQDFFDAYDQVIPPAAGRKERLEIYELYHHLNHYSMFGGGYDSGCLSILEKLF
jgi:fructosamine-3-kinase